MYRTLSLLTVCVLTGILAGCQQRIELVLNEDGSGTLRGERTLDDRVVMLGDLLASNPGSKATFLNSEVLECNVETGLLEPAHFDTFQSEKNPDGSVTVAFEKTFSTIDSLLPLLGPRLLPVELYQTGDQHEAVMALNLSVKSDIGTDGTPDDVMRTFYLIAKGTCWTLDFTGPFPLTVNAGEADDRQISWTIDLRNQAGLENAQALVAGLDEPVLTATFPLEGLGFTLPGKELSQEETTLPKPPEATVPTAEDMRIELGAVVVEKTQSVAGGPLSSTKLRIGFDVTLPDGVIPLSIASPASAQVVVGKTASEVEVSNWSAVGALDTWRCSLNYKLPDPTITHLDALYAEARMTIASELETLEFDLEQLQAMNGKDQTGVEALDALGITLEMIGSEGLSFRYASTEEVRSAEQEDREITAPIVEVKLVRGEGSGTWSTSNRDWKGAYTLHSAGDELREGAHLSITVARAQEVMSLPLDVVEYDIP